MEMERRTPRCRCRTWKILLRADADYLVRDRNRRRRRHHPRHRVRYLRHKFVINEVAWLSGRGGAQMGFKRDATP